MLDVECVYKHCDAEMASSLHEFVECAVFLLKIRRFFNVQTCLPKLLETKLKIIAEQPKCRIKKYHLLGVTSTRVCI